MKGISVLIKEPPRSSAVLLPLEDTGSQVCTWKRVLTRTSHAGPSSWTSSLQNSLRPPPLSALFSSSAQTKMAWGECTIISYNKFTGEHVHPGLGGQRQRVSARPSLPGLVSVPPRGH